MTKTNLFTLLIVGVLAVSLYAAITHAVPEGPSLSKLSNSTKATTAAAAHTAQKGTINYVELAAIQQNNRWKAYAGNVTGSLVLQDSDGYNIYDWTLSTSLTGNIYASRSNSVNWSGNLSCFNSTSMIAEEATLQFTPLSADSINSTFSSTNHSLFTVNLIPLFNCSTVYTFESNARQTANQANNSFQEIIVQDSFLSPIYTTRVYQDHINYKGNGNISDFQMILPDYGNLSNSATVTYYFYVELT